MLKFKKLSVVLSFILILTLMAGCGSSSPSGTSSSSSSPATEQKASEAPKEKITFKLGHTGAPTHPYQTVSLKFAEIVNQKTNGQIEIKVFPADQLGKQNELIEGAQLGTVDMVLTSDSALDPFDPLVGVLNLPFLFKDADHVIKVLNGEPGKKINASLEKKNLIVLAWWENGFRHITNKKRPINVPDDLKGLKIRTPNSSVFLETFNTLGASATPMNMSEVYSALQLGTVDGQENPTTHAVTQKFYEVQKYISLTRHIHVAEPLIISKAVYSKLNPDQQKVLVDAALECQKMSFEITGKNEADELKQLKEKGMEVNEANGDAFREALKSVYAKFEGKFGKDLITQIQDMGK